MASRPRAGGGVAGTSDPFPLTGYAVGVSDPIMTPRRAEPSSRTLPWRLLAGVVVVALVVGVAVWLFTRQGTPTVVPTPSPSATSAGPAPTATASSAPSSTEPSPSPSPSVPVAPTTAAPMLEGCEPMDASGFVPTRFQLENPTADERVLSLGLDSDGAIAAPPPNEPRTASWWNQGPRPGSSAGKVVLSIHTYRRGGALGNEMYDGTPRLSAGDLITLTDDQGRKACYEFVEATKVWVDDYDPNSDVMVDFEGSPMLAIVICWDFDGATENWDSRIFFYAKPVTL